MLKRVKQECAAEAIGSLVFQDVAGFADDPNIFFTNPVAVQILSENNMGHSTPDIPLFIYKFINDEVSPIADTDALVDFYCKSGATLEYQRDLLSEHGALAVTAAAKVFSFLIDAMNGQLKLQGCKTSTVVFFFVRS